MKRQTLWSVWMWTTSTALKHHHILWYRYCYYSQVPKQAVWHQYLDGDPLCDALTGFHAFNGSDYISAFVWKGNIHPFAFLENDIVAQKAFAEMSTERLNDQCRYMKVFHQKNHHVASPSSKDFLNQYCYKVFEEGYGPKTSAKHPLEKLKGITASTIPPCEAELVYHIHPASFIA